MVKSYLKPLERCCLKNGILTVPGLDEYRYMQLALGLRKAIIDYQVPHWKVVAIHVKLNGSNKFEDFVSKPEGIDKSYAELIPVLKKVAAAEGGGEPVIVKMKTGQNAGCYYKTPGDMAFIADTENTINTYDGNLTYESQRSRPVKFLSAVDILKANSCTMQAIMYRGTGCIDFSEAGKIIDAYSMNTAVCESGMQKLAYCPMTAVYDLSQFVTVKYPDLQDKQIKLFYKDAIDEEVLKSIFVQFAEEL